MQFDFGENWKDFSVKAINSQRIEESLKAFRELIDNKELNNETFLDIGFGQGLGLLNATLLGAKTVGCDINPKCGEVLQYNKNKYPDLADKQIPVVIGSINETKTVNEIKRICNQFSIVHSWGVLHHTGSMWKSIDISCNLVKSGGWFILAIYNKHWSSILWKYIKWFYNVSPKFIKWLMIKIFYIIIFAAKFLVTFKNPLKKERGMNFYYDIIDWLGGYPYEYATHNEIKDYVEKKGFKMIKSKTPEVPTGCNEFIFQRINTNN